MSDFSIVRPSETPTLAHSAFVDSGTRCPYCGKKEIVEIHYDGEGLPYQRIVCLGCTPYSTRESE